MLILAASMVAGFVVASYFTNDGDDDGSDGGLMNPVI